MAPQRGEIFKQKVNDCVQHAEVHNFHAIRSWNFRIFAMRWWPRFLHHHVYIYCAQRVVDLCEFVVYRNCMKMMYVSYLLFVSWHFSWPMLALRDFVYSFNNNTLILSIDY